MMGPIGIGPISTLSALHPQSFCGVLSCRYVGRTQVELHEKLLLEGGSV